MRTLPATLLVGAFAFAANATEIVVTQKTPIDIVSFSASGDAEEVASKTKVTLRTTSESSTLREGISKSRVAQKELIDYLVASGIPRDDIKTEKFSSVPEHGILKSRVRSYTVTATLEATVSTEKQFLAVAHRVDESSVVEMVGPAVDYSNREEISRAASLDAYDNLEKKKKVFEERLGVKLELASLSEVHPNAKAGSRYVAPVYSPSSAGLRSGGYARNEVDGLLSGMSSNFGKISASVTLHASFRIIRADEGEVAAAR
ncbi:MAG: SIMPL domain-containing protein [Verrucomicrobiota bacterium]